MRSLGIAQGRRRACEFLAKAAPVLDDTVLDARIEQNQVEFTIADQVGE